MPLRQPRGGPSGAEEEEDGESMKAKESDEPTQVGEPAAAYAGSRQRPGLEPLTVMPGRYRAVAADVARALEEFDHQLATAAKRGDFAGCPLPKLGAFPIFRSIFKDCGLSVMVEGDPAEIARDLFQLVCGVCWRVFVEVKGLVPQVGVVFLVYLLFKSQHPDCFAIPVSVDLLEQLLAVREECYSREVLLECPKILRMLIGAGAFSVGVRATCRNLFFDRFGQLGERLCPKGPLPGTKAALAAQGAAASSEAVTVRREELGDLKPLAKGFEDYEAVLQRLSTERCQQGPAPARLRGKLRRLDLAMGSYLKDLPPEPRDIAVSAEAQAQLVAAQQHAPEEEEEEKAPILRRRRKRLQLDEDEEEEALRPVQVERCVRQAKETGQEDFLAHRKFRCEANRQSRLIGLDNAMAKGAALRSLRLAQPQLVAAPGLGSAGSGSSSSSSSSAAPAPIAAAAEGALAAAPAPVAPPSVEPTGGLGDAAEDMEESEEEEEGKEDEVAGGYVDTIDARHKASKEIDDAANYVEAAKEDLEEHAKEDIVQDMEDSEEDEQKMEYLSEEEDEEEEEAEEEKAAEIAQKVEEEVKQEAEPVKSSVEDFEEGEEEEEEADDDVEMEEL